LLLHLLRAGDEDAFTELVRLHHPSLIRLARLFVRDVSTAEELAQETWLAALQGLERFEARSSLKTWLFTILTNKARTRGRRESRTQVFSELEEPASGSPTVDPRRFKPADAGTAASHWLKEPAAWSNRPEEKLLTDEIQHLLRASIDDLPENQRAVVTLRDIDELSSGETCNILGISETNQRVLLHRARARLRQVLEDYLRQES